MQTCMKGEGKEQTKLTAGTKGGEGKKGRPHRKYWSKGSSLSLVGPLRGGVAITALKKGCRGAGSRGQIESSIRGKKKGKKEGARKKKGGGDLKEKAS